MVVRSPRDRLAELIGSMLAGTVVAIAMCVVMVLVSSFYNGTPQPEQCAWMVLMSILGTWAVMIPSKFWEGTRGEPMLRRFIMMVVGLGLGAIGFLTADLLMVDLPYVAHSSRELLPDYQLPPSFYADGRPLMMAYLACFGTLFLLLRWWKQANPMRRTRLSMFWALPVTILAATVVATVWHFPQPWLPMVAGTIAVAVQLATPWVHPRLRPRA